MSEFSGNERIASAKQCQLQQHYPRLEGFQEVAHTSRQAVPGNFQGRFGIQARRPPEARPHTGYWLLDRPGLIPVLTCLRFPKEIEHGGTGGHCRIPTVLSNILKEICPFVGTPQPWGHRVPPWLLSASPAAHSPAHRSQPSTALLC